MRPLAGYEILNAVHETPTTRVSRALRLADNREVAIKTLKGSPPHPNEIARLKREYRITKKAASAGIIEAYDLVTDGQGNPAIILEFFAESIASFLTKSKPFSLDRFFSVATSLAEILGKLHNHNLIHKNLNPQHMLLDPPSNRLKIINFGIAAELPRERQGLHVADHLEGSLPYISPEQTGRINRGLDYRTDYYSLGASFFEMLTGEVPFKATDKMSWVYCHIGKEPPRPSALNPDIPRAIDAILGKLMAKNPEDRYQSSHGLLRDLSFCRDEWERHGAIDEFVPGRWDVSERFQIPQQLYGRDQETALLLSAFDRVAAGATEFLMVSGYAGVGKSALVHEIQRPIVRKQGYFFEGKFDQLQRHVPFNALASAFRHLVNQLLSEPADKLLAWKGRLRQSFGPNGQIVLDLIPELEAIVGRQPPLQELGLVESQNRFKMVLSDFIAVFADAGHPLVIFLDDLQWSDIPTLDILRHWMQSAALSHLLVIAAYRDNEVDNAHPLNFALQELQQGDRCQSLRLASLLPQDTNKLIADCLWTTAETCAALAKLLHRKTDGNPFFLGELLKDIHKKGQVWFDPDNGRWTWDDKAIQGAEITANILDFLLTTLRTLPPDTRHALRLAACIGHSFDLKTLSIIHGKALEQTNTDLFPALRAGLVSPLDEDYKFVAPPTGAGTVTAIPRYAFQHDRVQQAAYSLIDDADRQRVHLAIGRSMLASLDEEEKAGRLADILEQLNKGRALMTRGAERETLARMNLSAGIRAKDATAYQPAFDYLKIAYGLLGDTPWEDQYALAWAIAMEYCQCAYLTGAVEQAEELVGLLLARAKQAIEKAEVHYLQQRHYLVLSRTEEAIQAGLKGLSLLGIAIAYKPHPLSIAREFIAAKWRLRRHAVPDLLDLAEMEDGEKILAIKAMSEMSPAVYNSGNENLVLLMSLKMLNLSLRHGNSRYSPYAYFVYANFLTHYSGKPRDGYAFGKLAVALNEKYRDGSLECRTLFTYNFFIRSWNEHWENLTPGFQQATESALQYGDLFYLAYSSLLRYAWHPRLSLEEKIEHLRRSIGIAMATGFDVAIDSSTITHQAYLNYHGGTADRLSMNTQTFDEDACIERMRQRQDTSGIAYYHYFKADILFFYEQYRDALGHIAEIEQHAGAIKGSPTEARTCVITFFSCAALLTEADPRERRLFKRRLDRQYRRMQAWTDHCPENFLHVRLAMDGERERLAGRHGSAASAYAEAAGKAAEGGWRQDEGMIRLLACRMYRRMGLSTEAAAHLRDAYRVYLTWGAHRKLEFLREQYHELWQIQDSAEPSLPTFSTERRASALDLDTVFKAAQALSEEVVSARLQQKLLTIVCENAGAESGYLLLPSADGWRVTVSCVGNQAASMPDPVPLSDDSPVSQAVVNYVTQTKGNVVLFDAAQSGQFVADPHIQSRQTRSLLCLPLLRQGEITAILYLENNLTRGAFTSERLKTLALLGAQAAISLENAVLYANLEDKVRERTSELSAANRNLHDEIIERQRAETQAQQAKREAQRANQAKSRFLANMSHELRTPLNGIMGYAQILKREKGLRPGQYEGLDIIHHSGQHLLTLINDVLDLAKIEAGRLELVTEAIDLPSLVNGVVDLTWAGARQKDLQFVYRTHGVVPAVVESDAKRLRQVLLNLLGNAVKFTAAGGTVTFDLTNLSDAPAAVPGGTEARLRFSIRDTGVGMTPAQQAIIFQPFEQAGSTKQRNQGTGLGLSIARQIVNLMGGDIRLESAPGDGSVFWFEVCVPVGEAAAQPAARAVDAGRIVGYEGAPRTILVVDDRPENRLLMTNLLAPLGFQICQAEDGRDGLQQARERRPDLIVTDLVMPVMSGLEMVKRIRQSPEIGAVPIIAVSASVLGEDQARCRSVGCQAFLAKPIDTDSLLAKIAEHGHIRWVHDTTEPEMDAGDAVAAAESVITPPAQADLETLYELTMFGDLERVRDKALDLARQDDRYQAFARIIQTHAETLEDEPILALLSVYLNA